MAGIINRKLRGVQADEDRVPRLDIAVDVVMALVAPGVGSADEIEKVQISPRVPLAVAVAGAAPVKIREPFFRRDRIRIPPPIRGDEGRFAVTVVAEGEVIRIVLSGDGAGGFGPGRSEEHT